MKTTLMAFATSGILLAAGAFAEGEAERDLSDAESLFYEAKLVIESEYREKLAEVLAKGDRVEIFLLDFEMEDTPSDSYSWESRLEESEFPILPQGKKSKILKQVTLTEEQKEEFIPILQKVVGVQEEIESGALSHYPVHGVRVFSDESIIFQSSFCWECNNFAIRYPDAPMWVAIDGSTLSEAFNKLMPIPKAEQDRLKAKHGSKAEGAKSNKE